jgi:hypothetical protein
MDLKCGKLIHESLQCNICTSARLEIIKKHIRKQDPSMAFVCQPPKQIYLHCILSTPPSICWHPEPTITGNPKSSLVPVGTGSIGRANDSCLRGRMAFSNPKKKKRKQKKK